VAASLVLTTAAFQLGMPQLQAINLSKRLAAAANAVSCAAPAYVTAGYNEPSLVLLTDTEIDLTDGKSAAISFQRPGCRIAFIESRHEGAFKSSLDAVTDKPALRTRVAGININSGRKLDIGVYVRER
ncbi:MAG: glycosyl transferase, partial [Beijerinckiaceae bacterium]